MIYKMTVILGMAIIVGEWSWRWLSLGGGGNCDAEGDCHMGSGCHLEGDHGPRSSSDLGVTD